MARRRPWLCTGDAGDAARGRNGADRHDDRRSSSGRIVGNIGAGCHESEIVEAAQQTARDGQTRRVDINLTIEDEVFGAPGCGAIMQVVAWRPHRAFAQEARAIVAGESCRARRFWLHRRTARSDLRTRISPRGSTILIGATPGCQAAAIAVRDFNVIVVDPRPSFATKSGSATHPRSSASGWRTICRGCCPNAPTSSCCRTTRSSTYPRCALP